MKKTIIYLIRHGETAYNKSHRFQGGLDIELNEKGILQSAALAEYLRVKPFTAAYASDLSRALQTAAPLANCLGLNVGIRPALREIGFGAWEGMDFAEISQKYPREMQYWLNNADLLHIPDGEKFLFAAQRAYNCLLELVKQHEGEQIYAVTHGGIIRLLFAQILHCSFHAAWQIQQDNCAVNVLEYTEHGFSIALMNYIGYQELKKNQ